MSTIDTNLEWPRFCYSNSKEVQADVKKLHGRKLRHKSGEKISPKNLVVTDTSMGLGSVELSSEPDAEKFAFSQLMRQMAEKYQDKSDNENQTVGPHFPPVRLMDSLHPFQLDPLLLQAAFGQFLPFPVPTTQPSLFNSFSSSHALIAMAARKRHIHEDDSTSDMSCEINPKSPKRERIEDPLDLSSNNMSKYVANESSLNGFDDPETWSVDKVGSFVANVPTCSEYAEVFRSHSIDGSALLELTENHMTRIMGLKLGPAIKLRICIKELQKLVQGPTSSSSANSGR